MSYFERALWPTTNSCVLLPLFEQMEAFDDLTDFFFKIDYAATKDAELLNRVEDEKRKPLHLDTFEGKEVWCSIQNTFKVCALHIYVHTVCACVTQLTSSLRGKQERVTDLLTRYYDSLRKVTASPQIGADDSAHRKRPIVANQLAGTTDTPQSNAIPDGKAENSSLEAQALADDRRIGAMAYTVQQRSGMKSATARAAAAALQSLADASLDVKDCDGLDRQHCAAAAAEAVDAVRSARPARRQRSQSVGSATVANVDEVLERGPAALCGCMTASKRKLTDSSAVPAEMISPRAAASGQPPLSPRAPDSARSGLRRSLEIPVATHSRRSTLNVISPLPPTAEPGSASLAGLQRKLSRASWGERSRGSFGGSSRASDSDNEETGLDAALKGRAGRRQSLLSALSGSPRQQRRQLELNKQTQQQLAISNTDEVADTKDGSAAVGRDFECMVCDDGITSQDMTIKALRQSLLNLEQENVQLRASQAGDRANIAMLQQRMEMQQILHTAALQCKQTQGSSAGIDDSVATAGRMSQYSQAPPDAKPSTTPGLPVPFINISVPSYVMTSCPCAMKHPVSAATYSTEPSSLCHALGKLLNAQVQRDVRSLTM